MLNIDIIIIKFFIVDLFMSQSPNAYFQTTPYSKSETQRDEPTSEQKRIHQKLNIPLMGLSFRWFPVAPNDKFTHYIIWEAQVKILGP